MPGAPPVALSTHLLEAFKLGMRERGYVEGKDVVFECRFGEFQRERISEAAAELVRLKVDVPLTAHSVARIVGPPWRGGMS